MYENATEMIHKMGYNQIYEEGIKALGGQI
jgi:hypothetical protein